jgi:hypothetical protein
MPSDDVRPPSKPPSLGSDTQQNVDAMVRWFKRNFADPESQLPRDPRTGDFIWSSRGPFDAEEEITRVFYAWHEREVAEAVRRIEWDGVRQWTVARHRVPPPKETGLDSGFLRTAAPSDGPTANVIVQTLLFPREQVDWRVYVTFVPGSYNGELGEELPEIQGLKAERVEFESVRGMIAALVTGAGTGTDPNDRTRAAVEWIGSLNDDSELFTDNVIAIHSSPPRWLPIKHLGPPADGMVATAIVISAPSLGQAGLIMLAYAGSRIFLQLVRNVNRTQDVIFERVQRRIRRGDWKPWEE